jgi:hypothetical protein
MVWGLLEPEGFGDYFPRGDYVGWEERLTEYFYKETEYFSKEFRGRPLTNYMPYPATYRGQVIKKFQAEPGTLTSIVLPVEAPLPHEWPDHYQTRKTHEHLSSPIMLNSMFYAVDEKLKALIEELEPGVHDFRPIRITMPRGKDYPVPYHVILIRQFRDSFRPDLSEEGVWSGGVRAGRFDVNGNKKSFAGAAMSSEAIGGAHIWRERSLERPIICLSDRLHDEIVKAGLRMMKHYKMKSV